MKTIHKVVAKKIEGSWSVVLDGYIYSTGHADRVAAVQAAQTLRLEHEYAYAAERASTQLIINQLLKGVIN